MENTTLHLPELYLELIGELLNTKDYPCTSEFIRIAIRKLLKKDLVLLSNTISEQTSQKLQQFLKMQHAINKSGLESPVLFKKSK
ncbi:MAG: hypothetical protein LUQ65_14815 [Candidatus Helarchaeota archaeon]|nr:hypothetical protein [Candidatus Helarchaeota archaeon]